MSTVRLLPRLLPRLLLALLIGAPGGCVQPHLLPDRDAPLRQRYEREASLISRAPTFDLLARYERRTRSFSDAQLEADGKPLLVHLWSVYCPPCVAELPLLPELLDALQRRSGIRTALISEDSLTELGPFLQLHRAELQSAELYAISSESPLRADLEDRALPLTLLLDGDRVVRQAFIGPLRTRRYELLSAVDRLSKPRSLRRATHP